MKISLIVLTAATLTAAALPLGAQQGWSVELAAGPAVPTGDLGELSLDAGLKFGATVGFRVMPHLAVYGGWDWVHFSSDGLGGGELDVEETGYTLGLRYEHPLQGETGFPKLRAEAGGTYKHLEVEDDDGEIIADSDHGLGWEAGAGLVMSLGDRLTLTPMARFRSLSRDLDLPFANPSVEMQYLTFELAAGWTF